MKTFCLHPSSKLQSFSGHLISLINWAGASPGKHCPKLNRTTTLYPASSCPAFAPVPTGFGSYTLLGIWHQYQRILQVRDYISGLAIDLTQQFVSMSTRTCGLTKPCKGVSRRSKNHQLLNIPSL